MSIGKMNTRIDIVQTTNVKDAEGFSTKTDTILVSVRAYREQRHASEKWANYATFSEATLLFRFRVIPNLQITTDMVVICDHKRYNILSVENIKGRNMYVEVLAKEVTASG